MGLSTKQVDENSLDRRALEVAKKGVIAINGDSTDDHKLQQPALQCPRCESINTKFCYYNNYSRLQPRHFCKACRRHWTAGGTLRQVPLGGAARKNKRSIKPPPTRPEQTVMKPFETNYASTFFHLPEVAPPPELDITSLASSSSSTSFDDREWSAFEMEIDDGDQQEMHRSFSNGSYLSCWDDILDIVDLELKTAGPELRLK